MKELGQCLHAASGYLTLGMYQDAWDELEKLPPPHREHDVVLKLRIQIHQGLGKWEFARVLAESLARHSPDNPDWWILWAYSLRREQSIEAAQAVLREAAEIHPGVALIAYNLACYACVLGELAEARTLLKLAFEMDGTFKRGARRDPDLQRIFRDGDSD